MILCVCEGVNDTRLRQEVRDGASTVRELCRRTGAGGQCGSCVCDLRRIVAERSPTPQRPSSTGHDLMAK